MTDLLRRGLAFPATDGFPDARLRRLQPEAQRQSSSRLPATRRMAVRVVPQKTLTRAQILLVESIVGEDEWTRWVLSRAKLWGWNGWHLRDSEGVIQSVHITRLDGFCEGLGLPDWEFWHEELGESFRAELKGKFGTLSKFQKRTIPSMRRGGIQVFTWWPKDWAAVERVFRYGLEGQS